MTETKEIKRQKLPKKGQTPEELEQDWRGLIAVIILLGSFILLAAALLMNRLELLASGIWTIMYAVTNWYFRSKENGSKKKNGV